METRYDTYMENKICILATYLDLRYKNYIFKNEGPDSSRNINSIENIVIEDFVNFDNERIQRDNQLILSIWDSHTCNH